MKDKPYVVLVGIDFSELANRALQEALTIASSRANAELHVLTVVPTPLQNPRFAIPAYDLVNLEANLSHELERLRAHVQTELERFGADHPGANVPRALVSHVNLDSPAHGLAQLASDVEADLIVVGTHNRKGIDRLLLGSVAEGTVRYARCPVLVIPAPEPSEEIPIEPPCPLCVEARRASSGKDLWCTQHQQRHGRRHTYHEPDRSGSSANFPLVFR